MMESKMAPSIGWRERRREGLVGDRSMRTSWWVVVVVGGKRNEKEEKEEE